MKTATQQTHMEVKSIPIDKIILTENTRKKIVKDDDYEGFKQSIAANGLLQPIGVVEKDGQYELTWGFRRLETHKDLGWPEISAVICTGVNAQGLKIIENMQRQDITPLELAAAIKSYQEDSGLTFSEIAGILGKKLTEISQINKLNDLIKPIKSKLEKEEIEFAAALFVARFPITEQQDFCKRYGNNDLILLREAKLFFGSRNKKVNTFPWPQDKEFKGVPKCSECNDRSSLQSVLFPEMNDQDDTCLNRRCMETKIKLNLDSIIKEKQKEEKVIFVTNDYGPNFNFGNGGDVVYKGNLRAAGKDDKNTVLGITVAADNLTSIGQVHRYALGKSPLKSSSSNSKRT
jgi:ParB/RepB/Spo0J family partition protein